MELWNWSDDFNDAKRLQIRKEIASRRELYKDSAFPVGSPQHILSTQKAIIARS